ncbi:MAG: hypothetical protein ABI838_09165 [Chloroflexota bacterium]
MQALLLKAGATLLTMLAALGSATYVGGHVKNGTAPLHPSVLAARLPAGTLALTPSVRQANVEPVTSTHAS